MPGTAWAVRKSSTAPRASRVRESVGPCVRLIMTRASSPSFEIRLLLSRDDPPAGEVTPAIAAGASGPVSQVVSAPTTSQPAPSWMWVPGGASKTTTALLETYSPGKFSARRAKPALNGALAGSMSLVSLLATSSRLGATSMIKAARAIQPPMTSQR